MNYFYIQPCDFSELLGAKLVCIEGAQIGSEEITFVADDGRSWFMGHVQDCCEVVEVNELIGEISDLLASPILRAEMVQSEQDGEPRPSDWAESWTWTFYKLATIRGEVVLRWLGQSNGYYSEAVNFGYRNAPGA